MKFPSVVDSTMRAAFRSCEHKFFREYMQHLRGPGGSIHLVAGGAFARGLEISRKFIWGSGASTSLALTRGIMAAAEHFGDFEVGENASRTHLNKMWPAPALALIDYFHQYNPKTDHIQPYMKRDGTPAVEFDFALPIDVTHPETGDPILYSGRFDMLGQYQKGLWVVDEKTTAKLGSSWINSWDLRAQFTGYVWGARQFNLPVRGAITRGVSFLTKGFGHAEVITYRPEWQIERWYIQLCRDVERMIQCWKDGYWDYDLADACTAYGGCPYKVLCQRQNPENWIQQYFIQERWNPLTGDTEEVA